MFTARGSRRGPSGGRDRKSGSAGMPRPRSTLFPYTTLFRSLPLRGREKERRRRRETLVSFRHVYRPRVPKGPFRRKRSEERFSRNAETEIYTLSLHDALPISPPEGEGKGKEATEGNLGFLPSCLPPEGPEGALQEEEIGRAVQQECRDRDLHSFPTRRSSDLSP